MKYIVTFFICLWPLFEICRLIYTEWKYSDEVGEIQHQCNLNHGLSIEDYAARVESGLPMYWLWFGVPILLFTTNSFFAPFVTLTIWYGGSICAAQNKYIGKILLRLHAQNRQSAKQAEFESHFHDVDDENDSDFSYSKSGFNDHRSSAGSKTEKPAPRGFEDRHPDDAKFWAYVDDPAATDGERKNAFAAILKQQAKRRSNSGGNVVKSPT